MRFLDASGSGIREFPRKNDDLDASGRGWTAPDVMLQILVDRRETLDLGEIVPVGDLFDAIAEGDEPFTESTRHHFENARNLYRRKLLPLIESLHGIAKAEAETRPKNDKAARALRAEDRLAKTLLLSALAPEVEVLKNLTATRLAALNHGSIRTPIEGREGQEVLRRCRAWAAEIGEVRIGDDPANPTITSSSRRSIPRASSPTPTGTTMPGIGAA